MGECWELEDGDTGEAFLKPSVDAVKATREYRAGVAFGVPEDAIDEHATAIAKAAVEAAPTGLPEYLDDMKWQLAYWEWLAKFGRRKRIWLSGWDHWALKWYAGGDEFGRHTVVVGPWVIALWSCRCDDCKADERALLAVIDREES